LEPDTSGRFKLFRIRDKEDASTCRKLAPKPVYPLQIRNELMDLKRLKFCSLWMRWEAPRAFLKREESVREIKSMK
jgi:hypothetical protein